MFRLEQTGIVVVAGRVCRFIHPNQVNRHFEVEAEAKVAGLKKQGASQVLETAKHKNILLSQIEALRLDALQDIEDEYLASYNNLLEEFTTSQKIHEESLTALSFFWVYGRAIINAEEAAQLQLIKDNNAVLQNTDRGVFHKLILGDVDTQINQQYTQKLTNLSIEKADISNAFGTSYKDAVNEETERFEAFVAEHEAVLKALSLDRDMKLAALTEFMDTQIHDVENQYDIDIKTIDASLKKVINAVNSDLNSCLKTLHSHRKSVFVNGAIIVGAALAVCAAPAILSAVAGKAALWAVQVSATTTGLGAVNNLFNGNGSVGFNLTANLADYAPKPYVPPYKAPSIQKDVVLPNNGYEPRIDLNPFNNNRISGNGISNTNIPQYSQGQATNYPYNNGNTTTKQPKSNLSFAKPESTKDVYQVPNIENKQIPNIERPQKTGIINWSRMAWRSMIQDKSPEVLNWQQNNRNRLPTTAAFFDGIVNSKSQRVLNAFSDEFAEKRIMFVADEVSLIKQGEQTKTAKFVAKTSESLEVLLDQDVRSIITKAEIFFKATGKFIEADYERLREGQATVIGTAIVNDFNAMANMTPEELAALLGHEAGDAFLIFLATGGLSVGGRALTSTMDSAIALANDIRATHTFHSPLLFQFQEGRLYSGFPVDVIKFQKPIVSNAVETEPIAKNIAQGYAQVNDANLAENIGKNYNKTGNGFCSSAADDAYNAIRASNQDVSNIAKNTGFKEGNIQKIKDHLFYDKHLLDRYVEYGIPAEMKIFDSDIAIANAWKRLELGVYNEYDIQLLKHETAEAWYMRNHDLSYTKAHNAADKRYPAPDLEAMENDFGNGLTNKRG